MEEQKKATETSTETIATQEVIDVEEDLGAKLAALEMEKAKAIVDAANYKAAFFKEKAKNIDDTEDEDERMARVARKVIAESRLAEMDREKDAIIAKALKENKELKLAKLNQADIPISTTSHTEGQIVRDTTITPEQSAAFKAMHWSDKDIERYKKNLQKNVR